MASEQENIQEQPVYGERLSFGIRTLISVVVNVAVGAIFLTQLSGKISRLDEILADVKTIQKSDASDANLQRAKLEAEIATINVRLAIIENQLHMNQPVKP